MLVDTSPPAPVVPFHRAGHSRPLTCPPSWLISRVKPPLALLSLTKLASTASAAFSSAASKLITNSSSPIASATCVLSARLNRSPDLARAGPCQRNDIGRGAGAGAVATPGRDGVAVVPGGL